MGLAFVLVDLFRGERPPRPVTRTKKAAPAPRTEAPPSIPEPAAPVQTRPAPVEPPATGPFTLPAFGEWTVRDVERLLDEQGDAFPEQREELELYLDTFRSVAGPDGASRATSTSCSRTSSGPDRARRASGPPGWDSGSRGMRPIRWGQTFDPEG